METAEKTKEETVNISMDEAQVTRTVTFNIDYAAFVYTVSRKKEGER